MTDEIRATLFTNDPIVLRRALEGEHIVYCNHRNVNINAVPCELGRHLWRC